MEVTDFVFAACAAEQVAANCHAAYWAEDRRAFLAEHAEAEFRKLAAVLGFEVEKIVPADHMKVAAE